MKRQPGGISALITVSSTLTRGVTLPRPGQLLVLGGCYWRATLVHAARFNVWTTLSDAFKASNLFALFGDRLLQGGDLGKQFDQQSLKLWTSLARKKARGGST